MPNEKVN